MEWRNTAFTDSLTVFLRWVALVALPIILRIVFRQAVHIDLKDDTLMISMKNVDGKKYLKHGLKYSIKDQCTAYFKYNDSTKKWSYLFHSYQQENH